MLLRSGKKYDPMMPFKLRNFMNFENPLFRTGWDEYANEINNYGRQHSLTSKECQVYLKQRCISEVMNTME